MDPSDEAGVRSLDGCTVVDLSQGLCGPFATQHLGDMGARVIKVEPPGGDYGRAFGPPFQDGESAVWSSINRNKESIVVDYRDATNRELMRRLISRADVVVDDLGPGVADGLGFGYESLAERCPALVWCDLSAFGDQGPWSVLPGSELVIQAATEYWSGQGYPGGEPVRLGPDVANTHTALYAVQAVLAALFHRGETGVGQYVSVSQFGVLLHQRGMMWASQSEPDEWVGHHLDSFEMPPVHGWKTKDRTIYFNMLRADESGWLAILEELDMFHVLADPRFDDCGHEAVGIGRYAQEVRPIWEEAFKDRTAAELIELFVGHGAFATLVNDYETLFADPQVEALGVVRAASRDGAADRRSLGLSWEIDGDRIGHDRVGQAPALDQHADGIRRWIEETESVV